MTNIHDNNQSVDDSITKVLVTGAPVVPLSMTSDEAISILDQVLQETIIDQEEQDDDYYPNSSISTAGMNMSSSSNLQASSKPKATNEQLQLNATKNGRSKKNQHQQLQLLKRTSSSITINQSEPSLQAMINCLHTLFASAPNQSEKKSA
ncbi:unnamed protein product [Rotaria sordida]|uniref:Uncharacterized protein n=1 Tax=Rotaria sordida TaxID=392033 RepID=A0A814TRW6_9BILA|nr:unnamed protein product [Rotaria sordida]CAF1161763.1 unnamed protein product [Rotaria sordida]CAF1412047.1 unnamed protein product [Rotaria sordida]CAF3982861.1 unnamed protein product [Rotaria sordida]